MITLNPSYGRIEKMKIVEQSVELIDYMGSDLSVVNAARVSFHKFHDVFEEGKDDKLISYLATHNHWSPFAHCFLSYRIKVPIFVARQLVKHQVGLVWNEVSRRYVDDEPEFWFEEYLNLRPESMKQGISDLIHPGSDEYLKQDKLLCELALRHYLRKIEGGVAPEQARESLPVNTMTEWIWSGSLAAFARVCNLRLAEHGVQKATNEAAHMIAGLVPDKFACSWAALLKKDNDN